MTGGAGFIGGHLARRHVKKGDEVTVVDNMRTGDVRNIPKNAHFLNLDVGSDSIESIFKKKYDIIYHFSGQSSVEVSYSDPLYDLDSNCRSTLRLLELCDKYCPESHFIYASTMSVYGDSGGSAVKENFDRNGTNFYAIGKRASEDYIRVYRDRGLKTTILRLFNIYGPGQNLGNLRQGMLSIFLAQALDNNNIIVKGCKLRSRDFLYIVDLLNMIDMITFNNSSYGEVFNMCSGISYTVEEVIGTIAMCLEKDLQIVLDSGTPGDIDHMLGNGEKFRDKIGYYECRSLESGVKEMVKSYNLETYFEAL